MPKTKISKVAKDLNVALPTVIDFLRSKNISVDENPNTRIEDDVVQLLMSEFSKDKVIKQKSDSLTTERQKNRPKESPKAEAATVQTGEDGLPVRNKPKFVGKIELDKHGNPKSALKLNETPEEKQVAETSANEVKAEPAPVKTPEAPAAEKPVVVPATPAPESAPEPVVVKIEIKETKQTPVEPVKEKEPEAIEVKIPEVEKKKEDTTVETPAPAAAPAVEKETPKQETTPAIETPKSEESNENDGVFRTALPSSGTTLTVVGKIDLDAINQSTRPKKKSKEERRNERAGAAGTAQGDRKKRKRISGKEKIDIEKTAQQTSSQPRRDGGNNGGNDNNNRRGGKGGGKDNQRNKRPVHTEVNEEDVQKQVKETLARLTNKDKGLKKGAKWRKEKREAIASREREAAEMEQAESRVLKLTEFVTANDLATMMDIPVNNVIATCMNIGVMVSINQRLDAETINIVAEEFGFETEYVSAEVADAIHQEEDNEEDLQSRPPIVTVMGHVDHGKTSLLDYIRKANVIAGEAGGITQHIGAYNVKLNDGRHITFLDTPGHEAFTAMRARGAKVTDLCIIIVAADDAVMPQTVEAINHASAAGVPIVFAINKIDKPHANPDKIKEELAAMNYLVEEWGGKYQSQDISAKKGLGVPELMEKVLLEAEMLDLKANPNRKATGSIIESSLDKGRGYVATVLVQNGTLRTGDIILAGNHFGKVKAMFNERNQRIKEAGPATPALILGLNGAPTAGDTFNVMDTEQEAREIASKREQLQREQGLRTFKTLTLEDIGRRRAIGNFQELNIIVKGDVDGSIEALSDSLIKLSTEEIQVNVLHKAVGEISESDVTLAAASDAIIVGFQVRPSQAARRIAERDGVDIRLYSVIYQAIEEVKSAMEGMLAPEIKEEVTGTAEVLEVYHISKVGTIAGAIIREGKIKRSCKVRLIREGIVRYTGELGSLKRFKDDVKEVVSGYDCGISIAGYNDIKIGDIIEGFEEVQVNRSL